MKLQANPTTFTIPAGVRSTTSLSGISKRSLEGRSITSYAYWVSAKEMICAGREALNLLLEEALPCE